MKEMIVDGRKFVINMTEKAYKDLQKDVKLCPYSRALSETYDVYGEIYIGALCMDLILVENEEEDADYCIDAKRRWVLDSNWFLLGLDTGYGEKNGIPYSYGTKDGSFVGTILQIDLSRKFDDAMQEIVEKLNEEINNAPQEIRDYAAKGDMTWEQVEKAS